MSNLMVILFWGASLCMPLPLFVQHLGRLWQIDQYQYFPVLILTLVGLVATRWNGRLSFPNSFWAWTCLGSGWLLSIVGAVVNSPWAACCGLIFIVGAWLASHHEKQPLTGSLFYLWFPCWLLLRLPFALDLRLTNSLQQMTSIISSELFNLLEIPHSRNGNVFQLPSGAMLVEEACSGVQSLFSLLFCAFLLVAWTRRSWLLLPMYAAAAIGSALIMNIIRVMTIGVAQEWYATDLSHGVWHEVLGYLCLALAIGILGSADCLLRVLFFPLPEATDDRKWNPIQYWWNQGLEASTASESSARDRKSPRWLLSPATLQGMAGIFCILALVFWIPQFRHILAQPATPWQAGKQRFWIPSDTLFSSVEGLLITKHTTHSGGDDPVLGENADVWDGQYQGMNVQLIISQPYPEFHELIWCYTGQGWEQTSYSKTEEQNWEMVAGSVIKPPRQFGYMIYGGLGRDGEPVSPPEANPVNMVRKWLQWRSQPTFNLDQSCLMLQLFTQAEEPLSKDQARLLTDLFIRLRTSMRSAYQSTNSR